MSITCRSRRESAVEAGFRVEGGGVGIGEIQDEGESVLINQHC
jgi:hypothetical protein